MTDPWAVCSLLVASSRVICWFFYNFKFICTLLGTPEAKTPWYCTWLASWRNLQQPLQRRFEDQLWLMSLLKVDQTLMLRRGNWSKGILNYLMRGSLSERLLFLSSFILTDHMADLYITKELPGWPTSLKTPPWSRDALRVCMRESKFWSEGDPQ